MSRDGWFTLAAVVLGAVAVYAFCRGLQRGSLPMYDLREINRRRRAAGRAALTDDRARALIEQEKTRRRSADADVGFDGTEFLSSILLANSSISPDTSHAYSNGSAYSGGGGDYGGGGASSSYSSDSGSSSSGSDGGGGGGGGSD